MEQRKDIYYTCTHVYNTHTHTNVKIMICAKYRTSYKRVLKKLEIWWFHDDIYCHGFMLL